ncbi:unnamed protein product [Larinioides sclopetarius]|uniref:Uncharacterized protein n=1 Tax=Larinioides sclopetarius TaxID=280406 RepID=A0AAV2BTS8_9ARAC
MSAPGLRLYDICLKSVSRILGDIRDESPNRFSAVPHFIIHDLITSTLKMYPDEGFKAHYLEPLLLSGQVKQLALRDLRLEEELLPTLRSFTVCRGLTSLSLINICEFNMAIVSGQLEELLVALKNLEELHCSVVFRLSALRKCRKLRVVQLHFTPESAIDHFLDDENGHKQTHETLSFFTLCGQRAERFVHFKQELFLKNSEFLSDSFLSKVLKDNPMALSQLRTACLCDCRLTKEGLRNLLSAAKKLDKISVESSKISEEDAESLMREFNPALTIIPDYDEGLREEFFYRRRYVCA